MQGQQNHGVAHYRCRFPADYAQTANTIHPRNVYLRESTVVPELDRWLATAFDNENLDETCEALAIASAADCSADARAEAARRKVIDCDARLERYRATLDAGGNPLVIARWMREVEGERQAAESELRRCVRAEPLTKAQVKALLAGIRDSVKMLADADPELKARVYAELDLRLEYRPEEGVVMVEAPLDAWGTERVGGAIDPPSTPVFRGEWRRLAA